MRGQVFDFGWWWWWSFGIEFIVFDMMIWEVVILCGLGVGGGGGGGDIFHAFTYHIIITRLNLFKLFKFWLL